ncbi:M20 family metallo-hydrolase [bacterium]|nr:M20 family metallo-hydrolase [bacterium]
MAKPRIDSDRLQRSLAELAKIGAYKDERTGLLGVNRLALTEADGLGRRLVKTWFEEAGLSVRVDRIGNVYARRRGRRDLEPVLSGSHIDSVPTGGAFDGSLGVLGALEVVRALDEARVETDRPIEIAFFTEEEGCRFGTDMLGSAVAVGRIPLERALSLKDRSGLVVRDELAKIGFAGTHDERLSPPHAYVECHIEQGPILRAAGKDLGVVTGVQAISWQEVSIQGKSAHAGTTPMSLRRDAGLAAARINLRMHEMAVSGKYGPEMRATMGGIEPAPGLVNIVPGRARVTVDLRNPDDALMTAAEKDLALFLRELEKDGFQVEARQTAKTPRVAFSSDVQAVIAAKMEKAGYSFQHLMSGAGHDAQEMASLCPTAMVFCPGEYDGISHNPRELSTPKQCADGVSILLETILELATT